MIVNKKNDWFNQARYGMFIHWGAYSQAARGEWIVNRERMPQAEYIESVVANWKAEKYDPRQWVELARDAGMKYIILTTRHHDGLALWNSKATDFNAVNLGPGRDLIAEFVAAVRRSDLKLGFYYSPTAWYHKDYPGAFFRDWAQDDSWRDEKQRLDFIAYYREELTELLTQFGQIDYLWLDGCIPNNIDGDESVKLIKKLQPEILINNRLGSPFDVDSCEQTIKAPSDRQNWEACMTLNNNWGYHAGDLRWKREADVIELLLKCAEKSGNLLLNIGPMGSGEVPEASAKILRNVGRWFFRNRESVIDSDYSTLSWNNTASPITVKGNIVYLHFIVDPCGKFCWAEIKNRVKRAYILGRGEAVKFSQENGRIFLHELPAIGPDEYAYAVALELDGIPEAISPQTNSWIVE